MPRAEQYGGPEILSSCRKGSSAPDRRRWLQGASATTLLALLSDFGSAAELDAETKKMVEIHLRKRFRNKGEWPDIIANTSEHHPYSGSPLHEYIDLEQKLMPENIYANAIIPIAENIANKTAWEFFLSLYNPEARRVKRREKINPKQVAAAVRIANDSREKKIQWAKIFHQCMESSGAMYRLLSSFHKGLDPSKSTDNNYYVDCDMRVYMMLLAAKSHDVGIAATLSNCHMAACDTYSDTVFETTYEPANKHKKDYPKKYVWSFDECREYDLISTYWGRRLGYYRPMTQKELSQSISGNVLCELRERSEDNLPALSQATKTAEKELARLEGGRCLITNTHLLHHECTVALAEKEEVTGEWLSAEEWSAMRQHFQRMQQLENKYDRLYSLRDGIVHPPHIEVEKFNEKYGE